MYVLITSLVPVDWRPGHQIHKPHLCNPLKSITLEHARAEAWNISDPYGTHMTVGISTMKDVIDVENRLYIFECPQVSLAPKVKYEEPAKIPQPNQPRKDKS